MKKKAKVKIRKKLDIPEKEVDENIEEEEDDKWKRHWEKEKDPNDPKKLGGSRRPRPFKINYSDDD